jgi:CRISPR/Cas system-associated endoribonuclease Cas2
VVARGFCCKPERLHALAGYSCVAILLESGRVFCLRCPFTFPIYFPHLRRSFWLPISLASIFIDILFDIIFRSLTPPFGLFSGAVRSLLLLGAIALSMQGCRIASASADTCERIQNSVFSPPLSAQQRVVPIDKAAAIYESKQQAVLAAQLAQMPIPDETLSGYRNSLVALYRHDSDLGFQISVFMSPRGDILVSEASRSAYEQVANQRLVISQQVNNQLAAVDSYCAVKS